MADTITDNYPVLSVKEKELSQIVGERVLKEDINNILKALTINFPKYTDMKGY